MFTERHEVLHHSDNRRPLRSDYVRGGFKVRTIPHKRQPFEFNAPTFNVGMDMVKMSLLGASALRSAVFFGTAFGIALPAAAQQQGTADPGGQEAQTAACETNSPGYDPATGTCPTPTNADGSAPAAPAVAEASAPGGNQEITVTGSRIRRPNLESVIPITSISGEQFFQQGQTNVGDTLNDLPQLRSTFAQQNPGLGIGIAGLNLLDLRGLGTSRTLVVVNGRRHVPADILNNAVSPDVNTIPNDLIERVDIVTGSNSATYGSDAIAGVVNFVLRRDFNGLQIRGQFAAAEESLTGNQYVSVLAGKNFAGGRANVTLHGEYARQERIFGSDIPAFRQNNGLGIIDVDPGGLANGSDGFADRAFFRDFRSASINRFGLVPITQGTTPASPARCGIGLAQTNGAGGITQTTGLATSATGVPFNCTFVFQPTGALVPQTGTRFGTGVIGSILGGNGQTGREDQLLSVIPFSERLNFNLLAHFTVSEAFEPFIEAKWNRVNALGSNAGPSFIQGTFAQFDIRERVRLDNPFLRPEDRNTIASQILASGCNPSLTASCNVVGIGSPTSGTGGVPGGSFARTTFGGQGVGGPLNAADIAAINAGTYRFVVARQLADSGIRDEEFTRDTFRVVTGARGTFNDDWNYELSVNYGKFKEDTTTYGYLNRQRFLLSLDAGRNPATGQIQCRAQFDPAAATAFAGQNANLAADIAACVPYNPFGGADNSAAAQYFSYNATNTASLSQLDILGFVGGDSSQLFELPGGPIRFVVGGEYRREKAKYDNDDFIEAGATNAVVIGAFNPPTFSVKEVFGEVELPLLKDFFLARELTVGAAGRISDYRGLGTTKTWNLNAQWSPIRDIRFRANLGKAVRVPNVSETAFPQVPNFAPGFQDPCQPNQIGNNPNRPANCAAALGSLLGALTNRNYSLPIISGSNPNLEPESSKSLTLGAVVQPRIIPGLSLSVDYWRIKVDNVIVSLSAQNIANSCYDQPTLDNPFCALFTRFQGPGTGPLGESPGDILGNSLTSAGVNFAKRERRGIDLNAAYRTRLGSNARLDTQVIYVRTLKSSNYENPTLPDFENRILGEIGDPKDELRWDTDIGVGPFTFGYKLQYIGPMWISAYEDFNELPAACTTAGCPPNNADFADIRKTPAVFYHDIRVEYGLKNALYGGAVTIYGGVDNVLNTYPPLGSTGTGAGPGAVGNAGIYDVRGRTFYAGARVRF
jgi:outer membrane receptor protein involved in Fe transport